MNDTEQAALAVFPEQGIDLGYVARARSCAGLCNLPLKQHAALVSLFGWAAGHLRRHP